MIKFRGFSSVKGNSKVDLSRALIDSAANKARNEGYMSGYQDGYEQGMKDIRANQWGYVEKLVHEFAIGVRS